MHSLKGSLKIVSKEMGVTLYINIALTIALFALYLFISFRADPGEYLGVIFGPFYVIFLVYPFIFFKSYNFILALGGTRKQFIVSSFISTLAFLILCTIILNVLHLISGMTFQNGHVFHMAGILNDPNPAMYFWIDFLWLIILSGIGMFAQVINFNLGTIRTLTLAAVLILAAVTAYFFLDITPLFEFIIMDHLLFVHILALASLILLVLSAFMMKNAPLERGDRKLFTASATN
ncbi:hypothetical protein [Lacicoccus qingdaonensis]|uniref:Uncharacterized protein n=1 Tax=Lacicoccus qingdaonensis TaxID=576118 RepID=A0A1G9FUQ7_9BACL|nr:hypothetical protein [Salinicoccus qingdaonensis]SDK92072.1 hypothetical protein SAMN05216216_11410 [Salinicoccus qingdaonensis]